MAADMIDFPDSALLQNSVYPPAMIQDTVQAMIDYLEGEEVPQDNVKSAELVTSENVANYPSFE